MGPGPVNRMPRTPPDGHSRALLPLSASFASWDLLSSSGHSYAARPGCLARLIGRGGSVLVVEGWGKGYEIGRAQLLRTNPTRATGVACPALPPA